MKTTRGTIQVYTGAGKGKTTASLGLAMRALGHGQKVFMIQFMKGRRRCGEVRLAGSLRGMTLEPWGRRCFIRKGNPDPKDVRLAQAGLDRAREVIRGKRHDVVILDEINVALEYGLVPLNAVLEILRKKPRVVEVVLTGRNACPEIIEAADMVSEIREIKHHHLAGVKARKGVEF